MKVPQTCASSLTVSGVDLDGAEPSHATPQHHHVGPVGLVHPLHHLVVHVAVVEVGAVHADAPGVGQAADDGHPAHAVHGATLDLPIK